MSKNDKEKEYNNSNISSTPYDDVFRTMLNDCTRFILPLLNEIFGEHYDGTEKIVFANDYHFKNMQDGGEEKIITDLSFKVISKWGEKKYHLECQATIDNSMIISFFEYDSQIALDDATIEKDGKKSGGVLTVTFPHSAVLFLRSNENTGDVMKMKFVTPGGKLEYDIPIIKMQKYTLRDIWNKEMYLLIPFYIFTHEANFPKYNEDETALKELVKEFEEICDKMEQLVHESKMTELESRIIVELSKKVVDNIAKKYKKITRGVDRVMGGKVIETEAKKMYNRGISEGRSEGRSESLKDQIKKKLAKGKDIAQIADEIEESEETVLELIKQIEAEKQTI